MLPRLLRSTPNTLEPHCRSLTAIPKSRFLANPPAVTRGDVEKYREDGYVAFPDVLSAGELDTLRGLVDAAVEERSHSFPRPDQDDATNVDMEYYTRVFTQRVNLFQTNDAMREVLSDLGAVIGAIACALEGIPGIRIYHDQALYKEPWSNPTGWHLDNPFWAFSSPRAISMWLPLDDATPQNGCLHFLPKSHTAMLESENPFEEVKIGKNTGDVFNVLPFLRDMEPVMVPLEAGALSFHNGLTIHGAGPNYTPHRRRAWTMAMMPDGATFNGVQNILTDERFSSLGIGDSMNDDVEHPVLHKA